MLALALGTGLAIAIFTIVNAILLRPLPYREPDRLVMVWAVNRQLGWDQEKMSAPEMVEWERSGLFEGVVGFAPNMTAITGPGEPDLTHGYAVTPGCCACSAYNPCWAGRSPRSKRRRAATIRCFCCATHSG